MRPKLEIAAFVRPCVGERLSGDGTLTERRDGLLCAVLIDALGHGRRAHDACKAGLAAVAGRWAEDPIATLQLLHEGLTGSVGAVGSVCVVDEGSGTLAHAGVGNTVLKVFGKRTQSPASVPGTLGIRLGEPMTNRIHLEEDDIVVMHSDGISDRIRADDYPEIRIHSAQTIVRTMVKRFGKTFDDASCIAMRYTR